MLGKYDQQPPSTRVNRLKGIAHNGHPLVSLVHMVPPDIPSSSESVNS